MLCYLIYTVHCCISDKVSHEFFQLFFFLHKCKVYVFSVQLNSGLLRINLKSIIIGIQAGLVMYPVNMFLMQMFTRTSHKPTQQKYPMLCIDTDDISSLKQMQHSSDMPMKRTTEFSQDSQKSTKNDKPTSIITSINEDTVSSVDATNCDNTSSEKASAFACRFAEKNNSSFTLPDAFSYKSYITSNDCTNSSALTNNGNVLSSESEYDYSQSCNMTTIDHTQRHKCLDNNNSGIIDASVGDCVFHESNGMLKFDTDGSNSLNLFSVSDLQHKPCDHSVSTYCTDSAAKHCTSTKCCCVKPTNCSGHVGRHLDFIQNAEWFIKSSAYLRQNILKMVDRRKMITSHLQCESIQLPSFPEMSEADCNKMSFNYDYPSGLYSKKSSSVVQSSQLYNANKTLIKKTCIDNPKNNYDVADNSVIEFGCGDNYYMTNNGVFENYLSNQCFVTKVNNDEDHSYFVHLKRKNCDGDFNIMADTKQEAKMIKQLRKNSVMTPVACCWFCCRVPGLQSTLHDLQLIEKNSHLSVKQRCTGKNNSFNTVTWNCMNAGNMKNTEDFVSLVNNENEDCMPVDTVCQDYDICYEDSEMNGMQSFKLFKRKAALHFAENMIKCSRKRCFEETVMSNTRNDCSNNAWAGQFSPLRTKTGDTGYGAELTHQDNSNDNDSKNDVDMSEDATGCMKCMNVTGSTFLATFLCIFCFQCPMR